jgi:ribosomal protein L37E
MSILNGVPFIATKEHVNAPWSGNKKNFRCSYCGYKFKIGDTVRFIYTNDMNTAPGNPLVCSTCDTGNNEEMRALWNQKWNNFKEFKKANWWFFKFSGLDE